MNNLRNFLIYSVLAGGGSVSLGYYFIDDFLRPFAVGLIMVSGVFIAIYDFFTDGPSSISFRTGPTYRPESDVEAAKDEKSGYFFAAGVLLFGSVVLIVL